MSRSESLNVKEMIAAKFESLGPVMNERVLRLWAASEARSFGYGGIAMVHAATGLAHRTIEAGLAELDEPVLNAPERIRKVGGGRKALQQLEPSLPIDLKALVEPTTRGDPQSALLWTCKSLRDLADCLKEMGHTVSIPVIANLLRSFGYSLQSNRKTDEGKSHPDRDAQFVYINKRVKSFQSQRLPVISVDAKKKELVGAFKNAGKTWRPKGQPEEVLVYDFIDAEQGKAIPYGVYDIGANEGWVGVGCDHDTAEFAAQTITRWWEKMGQPRYPKATRLLVVADSGGSNSSRSHRWKLSLQRLADQTGLRISVCHLPPGTSKWNKIEHRLFSQISFNWRGQPLTSHDIIVSLIGSTKTTTGLTVQAELDPNKYPTHLQMPKQSLDDINLKPGQFHGEWNYVILPHK